ncbi:MAG: hypothetical protein COA44_15505 [Arcobacter sp.]|nr:MAG: hypothetical protein COA44_15505 [Arcobacter sp.]
MFRKLLFLVLPLIILAGEYPQPKSFSHAIKIFKEIDLDYKYTAFSQKEYEYDPATCMRKLYLKEDHNKEVVFVRIVPEELVAENLACYTQDLCTNMSGKLYHGLKCCKKTDKLYKQYERDIFNVMGIEKDTSYVGIIPPLHIRGNIARVYLYMSKIYKVNLTKSQYRRYELWNKEDEVDAKECNIHKQISKVHSRSNPWIKSACEILESKSSKSSQE